MVATSISSEILHVTTVQTNKCKKTKQQGKAPPPSPPKNSYCTMVLLPAHLMQIVKCEMQINLADHGFCWKAALNVGSDCEN